MHIWNLELLPLNKLIAHNSVALLSFISLFGIVYWNINEKQKQTNKKMTARQQ